MRRGADGVGARRRTGGANAGEPRRARRAARLAAAVAMSAVVAATAAPAAAQPANGPALVAAVGAIGVEPGQSEHSALAVELGWRFAPVLWGVQPVLTALATQDDSYYLGVGFGRDFALGSRWVAHVGFAAGAYEKGDGKELGQTLEFRSALDVGYRLSEQLRLGLTLAHLSNAGLSDVNPGIETLTLGVTWEPRRR